MKKYLISGALALVAGMYLTSCTHDDIEYSSLYEEKTQTFEQVFKNLYGNINPNHDWGFTTVGASSAATRISTSAGTRAENANANEWADVSNDTGYGGWLVPDPLTEGQMERVRAYFQTNPDPGFKDPKLRNFFVQQVYKGGAGGGNTTEKVVAANGYEYNSDKMNLLTVGQKAVDINNFNGGDATSVSVLDNGANIKAKTGMTYHNDKIMLMVIIDDTSCFGYHETASSNENDPTGQHNDRAALVSAAVIDAWAEKNGNPGSAVVDKWNRSFLGFDLAIKEGDQIWTDQVQSFTSGMNMGYDGLYYADNNIVDFTYDSNWNRHMPEGMSDVMKDKKGDPLKILISNTNFYSGKLRTISDSDLRKDINGKVYVNMPNVLNLINDGFYPVSGSAFKTWVKPTESFDHYYSDWIVTLTQAVRTSDEVPDIVTPDTHHGDEVTKTSTGTQHKLLAIGRVFVEDLYRANREDLDFNDAVFDAAIWQTTTNGTITVNDNGTKTFTPTAESEIKREVEIYVIAAGGTIPLMIAKDGANGGFGEVHQKFAAANPGESISGVTMINTRGQYSTAFGSIVNGLSPIHETFDYTDKLKNLSEGEITLNDIAVDVIWSVDGMSVAANLNNARLVEYEKDEEGNYVLGEDGKPIRKAVNEANAPHMICVPLGTKWASERKNIEDGYPSFRTYVGSPSTAFWNSATTESGYNLYEGNAETFKKANYGDGTEELVPHEFCYYTDVQEVSSVEGDVLWSGEHVMDWNGSINFYSLANRISSVSGKLRFYGYVTDPSDPWITVKLSSDQSQIINQKFTDPYVECDITDNIKSTLDNWGGILPFGAGFTLTAVTWVH